MTAVRRSVSLRIDRRRRSMRSRVLDGLPPPPSEGQNSHRPVSAMTAGTKVTLTATPSITVSAMPGPSARNVSSLATTSAAVPSATARPAVPTIGEISATARPTASCGDSPRRKLSRA
jgi:hypothetical protein